MLLVLVAARALLAQAFAPASRTAVGALVTSERPPGANAAVGLGTNGAGAVGPLLAAVPLPRRNVPEWPRSRVFGAFHGAMAGAAGLLAALATAVALRRL